MNQKMAERIEAVHEQRRHFLVQALSTGLLAGGTGWNSPALADLLGKLPGKMPEGKSVFQLQGKVTVDGKPATTDTLITAESRIETGEDSLVIYAVGDGAFVVRERTILEMSGKHLLIRAMQLLSGGLLSVFGRRDESSNVTVRVPTATLGIRGTGFYTESTPERAYFCTCYGHTRIEAAGESEDIFSRHHDAARYIFAEAQDGKRIVPAPFQNHTDLELMTVEALCGRSVPFVIPRDTYEAPRRDY